MKRKISIISAIVAPVLAIIVMVLMVQFGGKKASKSSDRKTDRREVAQSSPLGKYLLAYREMEDKRAEAARDTEKKADEDRDDKRHEKDSEAEEPGMEDADMPYEAEEAYEDSENTPQAPRYLVPWHDGKNTLIGTFNFGGAKYGFVVTCDFDATTGDASNPTYEASGYGSVSKLSEISISSDGTQLVLSGKAAGTDTYIAVEAPEGGSTLVGTMRRGNNNGTCTLTLQ